MSSDASYSLADFRDNSEGCSIFLWWKPAKTWTCGGSNGMIYFLTSGEDLPLGSDSGFDNALTAMTINSTCTRMVVAEGVSIQLKNMEDPTCNDIFLAKRTAPYTHLEFHPNNSYVLASSEEPDILVYSIDTQKIVGRIETKVGIRTFSLSPDGKHLIALNIDGAVYMYSITSNTFSSYLIDWHVPDVLSSVTTRKFNEIGYKFQWMKEGNKLSVLFPSDRGAIIFRSKLDGENWVDSDSFLLSANRQISHEKREVTMVSLSPNNRFLASVDVKGVICIWEVNAADLANCTPIRKFINNSNTPLLDIQWGQDEEEANCLLLLSGKGFFKVTEVVYESLLLTSVAVGEKVEVEVEAKEVISKHPTEASTNFVEEEEEEEVQEEEVKELISNPPADDQMNVIEEEEEDEEEMKIATPSQSLSQLNRVVEEEEEEEEEPAVKVANKPTVAAAAATVTHNTQVVSQVVEAEISDEQLLAAADLFEMEATQSSNNNTNNDAAAIPTTPSATITTATGVPKKPVISLTAALASRPAAVAASTEATMSSADNTIEPTVTTTPARKRLTKGGNKQVEDKDDDDDDDEELFNNDFVPTSFVPKSSSTSSDAPPKILSAKEQKKKDKEKEKEKEKEEKEKEKSNKLNKKSSKKGPSLLDNEAMEDNKATTKNDLVDSDDEERNFVDDEEEEDNNGRTEVMEEEEEEEEERAADLLKDNAALKDLTTQQLRELVKSLHKEAMQSGSSGIGGSNAKLFQPPFQSACTKFDDKMRRYLVWNHIGNITLGEENLENRIEIRFTNNSSSIHKNEAFADRTGFVIGSLGYDGAAFASLPEENDEEMPSYLRHDPEEVERWNAKKKGSTLYYHAFTGNGHLEGINESFRITLASQEKIHALAVGKGYIAIATSKQMLRIYNSIGQEISTTWLKGSVVTLTACDALLAIVYHIHIPFQESPNLALDYYDINWRYGCSGRMILSSFPVPISTKGTLEWIGFDVDHMILTIVDSNGMVSCLLQTYGWQWIPVLNIPLIRKSIEHKFWPIMIKQNKLVYVLLNGESKPTIYPQPIVSIKSLRIGFAITKNGVNLTEAQQDSLHNQIWEEMLTTHYANNIHTLSQAITNPISLYTTSNSLTMNAITNTAYHYELLALEQNYEKQLFANEKLILSVFQQACANQQIPVALSLIVKLQSIPCLEAGIQIANHFGRRPVAIALDSVLQRKLAILQDQQQQQQQEQAFVSPPVTQTYSSASSSSSSARVTKAPAAAAAVVQKKAIAVDDNDAVFYENNQHEEDPFGFQEDHTMMDQPPAPVVNGTLSRKLSMKQQFTASANNSSKGGEVTKATVQKPATNPFAIQKTGETPLKRKSVFDSLEDMKGSPSPKKTTALNRTSTFSQQARQNRLQDKKIL